MIMIATYQYKCDKTGTKSKLVNALNSMATLSEMIILVAILFIACAISI